MRARSSKVSRSALGPTMRPRPISAWRRRRRFTASRSRAERELSRCCSPLNQYSSHHTLTKSTKQDRMFADSRRDLLPERGRAVLPHVRSTDAIRDLDQVRLLPGLTLKQSDDRFVQSHALPSHSCGPDSTVVFEIVK